MRTMAELVSKRSEMLQVVCFLLDGDEYGVPIAEVKETIALRPLTPLPLVPDFIAGVISLRGEVVAVLDLGRLLGLPSRMRRAAFGPDARIVILRVTSGGRPASAGLLVDRLSEVRHLDGEALRPPPATAPGEAAALVRGVARVDDRPLAVLDLGRAFDSERILRFRRRA